ncbi:hypothetical protein Syun_009079 [Stephania yunnanensis]|uniref:Uncharacterized protein n=1 Tax=Stephania yunnanensis TaxID=152371 RepID=A0AAP0KEX4_9MAGN
MVENTQNGVFTCSDRMLNSLPRFTYCAVGRIGDNIFQPIRSCHVSAYLLSTNHIPLRQRFSSKQLLSVTQPLVQTRHSLVLDQSRVPTSAISILSSNQKPPRAASQHTSHHHFFSSHSCSLISSGCAFAQAPRNSHEFTLLSLRFPCATWLAPTMPITSLAAVSANRKVTRQCSSTKIANAVRTCGGHKFLSLKQPQDHPRRTSHLPNPQNQFLSPRETNF